MSRAAVVDFPEFLRQVNSSRIVAATDVFPKEPVDADDPVRSLRGCCCRRIAPGAWSMRCIRSAA
jgi:phosphoglycerate dehydrogenase-like enzyme